MSLHDSGAQRPPSVLVVDDSALVRQALTAILSRAGMQVTVARDPIVALEKMRQARPDAIVLDIEMPRMDGLTFLRRIMASASPVPVLICSGHAGPGTEIAVQALEEGALEIVPKPRLGVKGFLEESAERLAEAVRGAARAQLRVRRSSGPRPTPLAWPGPRPRPAAGLGSRPLVVMGASTGGTEALREVLGAMPADAPAIAVVQHMPEGFTAAFARRLAALCRIDVREARDGDLLGAGVALIAPGDRHLEVRRSGGEYFAEVHGGPLVSRHRPSVDVLFRSAVRAAGRDAIGVILTGMGSDGAEGLRELRGAGAHTIAQDEQTCVVFGMPGAAVAAGAASEVLPLPRIAPAILRAGA